MQPRAAATRALPRGVAGIGARSVYIFLGTASTIVSVSMADGGFFPSEWRWVTLTLICASIVSLLVLERIEVGVAEVSALLALTALLGWTWLSSTWSSQAQSSVLEAERGLVYLTGLLAVVLIADGSTTFALLWGVLGGATIVSAYSIARYLADLNTVDPLPLLGGPIGYPNALGILAAIGALVAVGLAALGPQSRRPISLAPLVVLVPTLVLTQSRGAWIAFALGLVLVAAFLPHRSVRALAAGSVVLATLVALAFVLVSHVSSKSLADASGNYRWDYWRVAWQDFLAHPALGSGAGTFGRYWSEHAPIASGVLDAHSLYLESLAELGVIGLVLVVAVLQCRSRPRRKRTLPRRGSPLRR